MAALLVMLQILTLKLGNWAGHVVTEMRVLSGELVCKLEKPTRVTSTILVLLLAETFEIIVKILSELYPILEVILRDVWNIINELLCGVISLTGESDIAKHPAVDRNRVAEAAEARMVVKNKSSDEVAATARDRHSGSLEPENQKEQRPSLHVNAAQLQTVMKPDVLDVTQTECIDTFKNKTTNVLANNKCKHITDTNLEIIKHMHQLHVNAAQLQTAVEPNVLDVTQTQLIDAFKNKTTNVLDKNECNNITDTNVKIIKDMHQSNIQTVEEPTKTNINTASIDSVFSGSEPSAEPTVSSRVDNLAKQRKERVFADDQVPAGTTETPEEHVSCTESSPMAKIWEMLKGPDDNPPVSQHGPPQYRILRRDTTMRPAGQNTTATRPKPCNRTLNATSGAGRAPPTVVPSRPRTGQFGYGHWATGPYQYYHGPPMPHLLWHRATVDPRISRRHVGVRPGYPGLPYNYYYPS